MRVLFGLAALAATANAQQTVTINTVSQSQYGVMSSPVGNGLSAQVQITVKDSSNTGPTSSVSNSNSASLPASFISSSSWVVTVANAVSAVSFQFVSNSYVGQIQYRWYPNYPNLDLTYPGNSFTPVSYLCDICTAAASVTTATPVTCNTNTGPGYSVTSPALTTPANGFKCSGLTRTYLFSGLDANTHTTSATNQFAVQVFDVSQPLPVVNSYLFVVVRLAAPYIVGDPQIVGMQGQDFQVHGMPDEVFNMVTYPTLQVNARFTYLESADCLDNFTACFAHPGTYISEEGIRVGKDKVRITAGSHKKGLSVSVNGKKTTSNVDLKQGAVEVVNHRRVVVHTNIMKITVSNSDKFLNQELELNDDKLIALGSKRRSLHDNQRFHAEVPLHGLQGQTWRNVEYPSGLDYEGSITDYHVVDGNLFGTDFVFNQFEA